MELELRARGLLRGLACGDAVGLPREGLAPGRARRRFGAEPRHAFVAGHGVISDDTEHAFMTGQALAASGLDEERFARSLAWRLRGWIACLPPGVGLGTLRACARLWLGFGPARSGVPSAGNGPLMRAPVIGFAVAEASTRARLVAISTRITHTHPLAADAALAVAEAAAAAREGLMAPAALLARLRPALVDPRWASPLARVEDALVADRAPGDWAAGEGLERGVTGYVLHTLPAVLFAWLRAPADWTETIRRALALGGDTDTVGAIAGALAGTVGGAAAVPDAIVRGLCDRPVGIPQLDALALALAACARGERAQPVAVRGRAVQPLRNAAVLALVLAHGLRRLLPPW
ncbi:MAG TPA: ADP-ribosylglycohydrolase family protein [Kofleriaceae bacterium]|nr:ADP-ribosylglycohydrolase family protein [Kofleriaceae bacterium]